MKRIKSLLFAIVVASASLASAFAQAPTSAREFPLMGQGAPAQTVAPAPQVIVTPAATIDAGTYAGQALMWVTTLGGGSVAAALTALIVRMFQSAGIELSDSARARFKEFILNGLNHGAAIEAQNLAGRGKIDVKNATIGRAVEYVQTHGADTIKSLGFDPRSQQAIDAIKAWSETLIADPAVTTPKILDVATPLIPAAQVQRQAPA